MLRGNDSEVCGLAQDELGRELRLAQDAVTVALEGHEQVRVKVLLQLPFSVLFGRVVDLYVGLFVNLGVLDAATKALAVPSMGTQIVFLVIGIVFTTVGIAMVVNMDFVPNPPDGGVQALTALTKWPFGRAKILWDGILLVVTCAVSLIFTTDHTIVGIGIGTVLAFFAIGNIISFVNKQFGDAFRAAYDKDAEQASTKA